MGARFDFKPSQKSSEKSVWIFMRFELDFYALLIQKRNEHWWKINPESDMETKRSDLRFCCYLQWKSMIFEVWQASESMKKLLKNDRRYCTGSDIRFLLILDWFLIDFGSILRSWRQPKVIKHQWKFKSKFVEAFGRVSSGLWDTFGAIWEVQEWFPGEWGCINDAGQRVGGGQGEGFICICI
mgnify:CR=1 FL=1